MWLSIAGLSEDCRNMKLSCICGVSILAANGDDDTQGVTGDGGRKEGVNAQLFEQSRTIEVINR